jgi:hypothetical protein
VGNTTLGRGPPHRETETKSNSEAKAYHEQLS